MTEITDVSQLSKYKHLLYKVTEWAVKSTKDFTDTRELEMDQDRANIIASALANEPNMHTIMLDLDVPALLVPSSTKGHSHLYIDVKLTWEKYERLLLALAQAGIIERGYAAVSTRNKLTSLRLPWVKKEAPEAPGKKLTKRATLMRKKANDGY